MTELDKHIINQIPSLTTSGMQHLKEILFDVPKPKKRKKFDGYDIRILSSKIE